jgi:hypothetical protein
VGDDRGADRHVGRAYARQENERLLSRRLVGNRIVHVSAVDEDLCAADVVNSAENTTTNDAPKGGADGPLTKVPNTTTNSPESRPVGS